MSSTFDEFGKIAKLLKAGHGGITAEISHHCRISGYTGHDWTKKVGPDTIAIDLRTVPDEKLIPLVCRGPMVCVDLPANSISRLSNYPEVEPYNGNASGFDTVSMDVWLKLYEDAGATVYRTPEAVAEFARKISQFGG